MANKKAYASHLEHLSDELRHLDLLIHLQVIRRQKRHPENPLHQFKGLVLSEEEITGMLRDADSPLAEEIPLSVDPSENHDLIQTLSEFESRIKKRLSFSIKKGIYLSLPHLSHLFNLSSLEERCLLICLAPELDYKYEKLYAYLQDDVMRHKPSVGLVLNLLCRTRQEKLEARLAFDPHAPLLKYRLLQMTDGSPGEPVPLLSRSLKMDDRIVNFLLGSKDLDARVKSVARLIYPKVEWDHVMVPEEVKDRMRGFIRLLLNKNGLEAQNVLFYLFGPYGSGKHSLIEAVCRDLEIPLIIVDIMKILSGQLKFEEILWLFAREALLQPAILCLENFDYLPSDNEKNQIQLKLLLEVTRIFSRITFLLGSRPWKPQGLLQEQAFIELTFPTPDDKTKIHLWEHYLKKHNHDASHLDLGSLAGRFRFTPGQIEDALISAQNLASWRSPKNGHITMEDLYTACRAQSNPKLNSPAYKIDPKYTWEDIVLPSDQLSQLKEICNYIKYRHVVYGDWGFDRKLSLGKGLNTFFSGPPGTGKTMASEIIANALQLDLYKIDLSQVVSKYIGETEKNLQRIFTEAQASSAILFFDEADALFGKRSEVKDAHDRYANIEIGYLLQKMEEYEGITILATNFRNNVDDAFIRRMHIIIEFPFPDEMQRELIWKGMFLCDAPISDDIDYEFLSKRLKITGGNIKNIVISAAFNAAEASSDIGMSRVLLAARKEYQKMGKPFLKVDFEPYYKLIEEM